MSEPFPTRAETLSTGALRPIAEGEASFLAAACAAIDPWRRLGFRPSALARYFDGSDPGLHRFALTLEGHVAGVLAVRWPWLRGPSIELLAVLPEFHRMGLGAAAVDWTAARAATAAKNLWTTVSDFNVGARLFWRRQGFAEIAPLPDLLAAGRAEMLMRRVLKT